MTGSHSATIHLAGRCYAAKMAGERVHAIAETEGITAARVYQLLRQAGWVKPPRRYGGQKVHGGSLRPHGGAISRFVGTSAHADRKAAALPEGHVAMRTMQTLFPSTVHDADDTDRILVSGVNSAKLGKTVMKGPWRGMPIFLVTLEERATCPASCHLLAECYGNAMHMARRHRYSPALVVRLESELRIKAIEHQHGFVVRLHNLGDFPDVDYIAKWGEWLNALPALHAFGYTAHPRESREGRSISALNWLYRKRWMIRYSVPPETPIESMQATTIWRATNAARVPEGIVCPAQRRRPDGEHVTQACATCALCFAGPARDQRIVFIGHGMRGGRTAASSP